MAVNHRNRVLRSVGPSPTMHQTLSHSQTPNPCSGSFPQPTSGPSSSSWQQRKLASLPPQNNSPPLAPFQLTATFRPLYSLQSTPQGPKSLAPSHSMRLNERYSVQPRRPSHCNRRSEARKAQYRTLPHNGHPPDNRLLSHKVPALPPLQMTRPIQANSVTGTPTTSTSTPPWQRSKMATVGKSCGEVGLTINDGNEMLFDV